ncbi:MAG: 50S ribosomal protein L23 [Deltaproteobacteria bacterium]|nr:50S ribosomal protein L23 [Deltaproteobacteria bacterium]
MNLHLLKLPHLTEKVMIQKETMNKVAFLVDPKANKTEIKRVVETHFGVTVLAVNTTKVLGKLKRMGRHSGKRPDLKKAVVTLKAGDKIEYFEG